jgi:hypothetical protein
MALQQSRGGRAVVALADQAAHQPVAGGERRQLRQGRGLVAGLGQPLAGLFRAEQDGGRHHLGGQLLEALEPQFGQHAPLLLGAWAEVAQRKIGAMAAAVFHQ